MAAGGAKSLRGKGEAAAVPKGFTYKPKNSQQAFIYKPQNSQQDRLSSARRDTQAVSRKTREQIFALMKSSIQSLHSLSHKLLLLTHIANKMLPNMFFKSEHCSLFNSLGSAFHFLLGSKDKAC